MILALSNTSFPLPEMGAAAQAAVSRVNAEGGVHGRRVELSVCNYEGQPTLQLQCARDAAADKDTAVIGSTSASTILPILQSAGIPYVGGSATGGTELTSPMSFTLSTTPTLIRGQAQILALKGSTRMAFAILAIPQAAQLTSFFKAGVGAGETFTNGVQVPETATDMAPYAADLVTNRTNGIALELGPAACISMLQALSNQGYTGPLVVNGNCLNAGMLAAYKTLSSKITLLGSSPCILGNANEPGASAFLRDMTAYAPKGTALDDAAVQGWASANLTIAALKAAKTITPAGVRAVLSSASFTYSPQVCPPVSFSKAAQGYGPGLPRIFQDEIYGVQVSDGAYAPMAGTDGAYIKLSS